MASHSDTFNNLFDQIMFLDICDIIEYDNRTTEECQAFSEGINLDGLHSMLVKLWQQLAQVEVDFEGSGLGTGKNNAKTEQ